MKNKRQNGGYSVVEITLALLVAAVGITAVFGMFPRGLSASRAAVNSAEAGALAEYVFSTMQVDAELQDEDYLTAANYDINVSHSLLDVTGSQPLIAEDSATAPNFYYWEPSFYGDTNLVDYADVHRVARFTYTLEVDLVPGTRNMVYARLEIWPGDRVVAVGADPNTPGSTVFYREFRTAP